MKVLLIGDIIGSPGRNAVADLLPSLLLTHSPDLVIANGENAAGGFGITPEVADNLFSLGIDLITTGNHIWKHKEIVSYIDLTERLLRPANYPQGNPGRGALAFKARNGLKVGVINVVGRVFMEPADCPFTTLDREIAKIGPETKIIVVDVHAEATSEKVAIGWYLDGRVSAVLGTHTHVPTADERILPLGTAYITDVGMTGPRDSVIGLKKEMAIERFVTLMPVRFEVAKGQVQLNGVLVELDPNSGQAKMIQRLQLNA